MRDRIFGNPITTLLGLTAGTQVSSMQTGDPTLDVVKNVFSVFVMLWGLFSKKG